MTKNTIHQRTIKIKLNLTLEQQNSILPSMTDAAIVFDLFSKLSCEYQSTSYMTLHKYGYNQAKELCPDFPTAYIQAVGKSACSSVKSWNSNNKKKKWKYKGSKHNKTLQLGKLTLSRRGNLTTISSNAKRIKVLHDIPQWFVDRYQINTNNVQAGQLYHKNSEFWLCLNYIVNTPNKTKGHDIIGVDRGLYNFVSLSDGTVISSKPVIAIKRKYQYNRKKLQQKGTRSAKRKLRVLSGREKRFMLDFNHVVSKLMANNHNVESYIMEDLTGIRTKRKGKKLNSWLSNWSYFQFQTILEYKCAFTGIPVAYIDPRYTSQKCNQCGIIKKTNRNKSKYVCSCGYSNHSDINAALNIRDNYVLSCNRNRPVQEANSDE